MFTVGILLALAAAPGSGDEHPLAPEDLLVFDSSWLIPPASLPMLPVPFGMPLVEWSLYLQEVEQDRDFTATANAIFGLPGLLLEQSCSMLLPDRIRYNGVTLFDQAPSRHDFATLFLRHLLRKELEFAASLPDSDLTTINVEEGQEVFSSHRFAHLQGKVVLDSLRKTFRDRFHLPSLDLQVLQALVGSGRVGELVAGPVFGAVSFARFGIEKKFDLGAGLRFGFKIEKASQLFSILTEDSSNHRMASLWLTSGDFPVGLYLTFEGGRDGYGVSFVGIATDLNAVFEAVAGAKGARSAD